MLAYAAHKERVRERQAAQSRAGREIGALPPVRHPERKKTCGADLQAFCLTYFPSTFSLPFSTDHKKVLKRIEESVFRGGLFALAMPRGSGKTTLCEIASLWAILYGHRQFVCFIGATGEAARRSLETLQGEIETNDILQEDFPEVCYPVGCLERIANRCRGQTYQEAPTRVTWSAEAIVLPAIAGSPAAGAAVKVSGLTGAVRGMKLRRADGGTVRPDLVIVDDPQTDDSANSVSQCAARERILAGAILGLAGPGKKIAGVMPCTILREGDVASRLLDRTKHPEWQGERCQLVYGLPQNEALWAHYAELRAEGLRQGVGIQEATAFYQTHREAMDAGCTPAWPERYLPDEISAVQHAQNLRLTDEYAFWAEYQNQPLVQEEEKTQLTSEQLATRLNRHARRLVPAGATHVVAGIDVQQALLFYTVVAWGDDFTGAIIDYGSWPDQQRPYYSLREAALTLQTMLPGAALEGQLHAGLTGLTHALLGREWPHEDGTGLRIERCLVDANWGQSTDLVYQFCRQSAYAGVLMPAHGKFVGASAQPLTARKKKPGERMGRDWIIPVPVQRRGVRYVVFDSNSWKSFLLARWRTNLGDRGALTLYGDRPTTHRLFAEHVTAEYPVRTESGERVVDEWKTLPHRPDNHFLDALVLATVAASLQGVNLAELSAMPAPTRSRPQVSFAELQRRAREAQHSRRERR